MWICVKELGDQYAVSSKTKEMIAGLEGAQQDSTPALDHSTRQPFLKVSQNCENDWLGKKSRRPALIRVQTWQQGKHLI